MKPQFKPSPAVRWLSAYFLLSIVCASCGDGGGGNGGPPNPSMGQTYTTRFSVAENPISESGKWVNGKTVGLDWSNVATNPGLAYGVELGTSGFDDSTALLTGTWGSDQWTEATVHTVNQNDAIFEEVELRLRSALSPNRNTGYEINFRCSKTANAYTQIVRWDGPLGKFTYLKQNGGAQYGIADGDVVKATAVGNVITAYINGVQVAQATDTTFTHGSPGIGFYLQGATSVNTDYGFTSFTASDKVPVPSAPTELRASVQ